MPIVAYEMAYTSADVEESGIVCIPYEESRFQEYMGIYNACFYDMRKALDIQPYNCLADTGQIAGKQKDIFLLVNESEIIGSVACCGNEIDDLIVSQKYQRRGYGRQLLLWGMNHIRSYSHAPITLHVAEWNESALRLYREIGFEITRVERIR